MIKTAEGAASKSLNSTPAQAWDQSTAGCANADKLTHIRAACSLAFQMPEASDFDELLGAIDAAEKRDKLP
jgi:hypothetical protein